MIVIIAILSAIVLVGIILWLRPSYDPLVVMTGVGGFATVMAQLISNFMKSQETHDVVNGITHEWQNSQSDLARAQGTAQGIANEQARVMAIPIPTAVPRSTNQKGR